MIREISLCCARMERGIWGPEQSFAHTKNVVRNLPVLRVLQTAQWPFVPDNRVTEDGLLGYCTPTEYVTHLQGFAQACFEQEPRCTLEVVAFGSLSTKWSHVTPIVFRKDQQIDDFGVKRVLAVRMGWSEYKERYAESQITLLNHATPSPDRPLCRDEPYWTGTEWKSALYL